MPIPEWMRGCPGRSGGVDVWSIARIPSLTGLHQYDRVSHKKDDAGKTSCKVCSQRPPANVEAKAWAALMEAEAEEKRQREQAKLMRLAKKGFME